MFRSSDFCMFCMKESEKFGEADEEIDDGIENLGKFESFGLVRERDKEREGRG